MATLFRGALEIRWTGRTGLERGNLVYLRMARSLSGNKPGPGRFSCVRTVGARGGHAVVLWPV
jgi:hypothetical protein